MSTFWSSANVEPKRKFKFLVRFSPANINYKIPEYVVKKVDKPGFTITETKHTFLGHNFFFPGKLEWKEISLSIVDPSGTGIKQVTDAKANIVEEPLNDMSVSLTEIIGLFGYQSPVQVGNALNAGSATGGGSGVKSLSKAGSVAATGKVEILQVDDDGNYVETWTLRNAWIKDIQFGSNDYSSDDAQEISIKLRYDWAEFAGPSGTKASYI
jgi:hypothetical protein